jgi:hypothetical protein
MQWHFLLAIPAVAGTVLACGSDGAVRDGDDGTTLTDASNDAVDTAPAPPPPWLHAGPIAAATPTPPTFPLFAERTTGVLDVLNMRLGNGRAMVVDFDGDGRDDIVALPMDADIPELNVAQFLRNTTPRGSSAWSFENWTPNAGFGATQMALLVFGDIDNDGDMDAFSGTSFRTAPEKPAIWWNDGQGRFTKAEARGLARNTIQGLFKEMAGATLADFDRDGFLDLYITTFNLADTEGNQYVPSEDELYRGDGTGGFVPVVLPSQHNPLTSEADPELDGVARRGYGVCPADFDDDGDVDLFINNYGTGRPAMSRPPLFWDWNFLWRNDGNLVFTDVGVEAGVAATTRGIGGVQNESPVVMNGRTYPGPIGGNGFGCHWADFDNDGDLDLVVGTIAHPDYAQSDRTLLHVNPGPVATGTRVFGEESAERGLEYYEDELHPFFVDIDNDGKLDLAVSRLRGGSKQEFYLQTQVKRFQRQTWIDSGVDIERPGATLWFDVDGDGDEDFFMPHSATGRIFENRAAANNFLVIELVAKAPRDATGARVTMLTGAGTLVREVVSGNGHYNAQPSRRLHFGLGGEAAAQQVAVRWPNGTVQILGDVKANYHLRIHQDGPIDVVAAP